MDLPTETQLRWILTHTAALLEQGAEPIRGLVLPSGEFFPDRFDGSPRSVSALFTRILDHAGLTDLKVEVTVVAKEGEGHGGCGGGGCGGCGSGVSEAPPKAEEGAHEHACGGGACSSGQCGSGGCGKCDSGGCGSGKCGSGGCGGGESHEQGCSGSCGKHEEDPAPFRRVVRRDDGSYLVSLMLGEVGHPTALTTAMVRSVAFMFMTEADAYRGVIDQEREPLTDLAAVLLGFGVLMANGSHIFSKGCGGVRVQSATYMKVDELTVALALFCKLWNASDRAATRYLEPTPAEHFSEAVAWAGSNANVVRMLRSSPSMIKSGDYKLSPARSWLSRVLGIGEKRSRLSANDELADLERALETTANGAEKRSRDPEKEKRLAELRALVEESLEK